MGEKFPGEISQERELTRRGLMGERSQEGLTGREIPRRDLIGKGTDEERSHRKGN